MTTTPAPTVPTLPQFRDQQFRERVEARLREGLVAGMTAPQVFTAIADEQRALAAAVVAPEVIEKAAELLYLSKQGIVTDPSYATSISEARDMMGQIMVRRAAEATQAATFATDPNFQTELLAKAQAAPTPNPNAITLEQVKYHEILEELMHVDAEGKPQVLAHIKQGQEGIVITHKALAEALKADGALHAPLVDALKAQLPQAEPARLAAAAGIWLGDRHDAALMTATQATNEGKAYQEAVTRSKATHPVGAVRQVPQPAPSHAAQALASKAAAAVATPEM